MSDPETFLSRWSRRKREMLRAFTSPRLPSGRLRPGVNALTASGEREQAAVPDAIALPTNGEGEVVARPVPASTGVAFDLTSLPPIQSITAETDIRGFLASGVPPELTRAALRRAWACDPNIRDFIGLADYDWDFNAADSMAGFGPLQLTDNVREMAARIVEPNRSEPGARNLLDPAPATPKAEQIAGKSDTDRVGGAAAEMHNQTRRCDDRVSEIGTPPYSDNLTNREHESIAAQCTAAEPDKRHTFVKRPHGGALPK